MIFATLIVLLFNFQLAAAQSPGLKVAVKSITAGKQLSNLIRDKSSKDGFALITPSELSQIDFSNAAVDDPCNTAVKIYFAQQLTGELTNTDCRLDDNSYADIYIFDGLAGEQATVNMGSGSFDSYLFLGNEAGTWILQDDDGGGATNARISATLPETGNYLIIANSAFPNEFGSYSVSLTGGPNCTFTFNPTFANIPQAGGTFTFDVATQPRCYWAAGSVFSEVSTTSTGIGNGIVTYSVTPNPVNQERNLLVSLRSASFGIRQAPLACTYNLGPASIDIGPEQTNGSFTVSAQPGCFWSASAVGYFLSASGSGNGNGTGTVNFTAYHNNGANRSGPIRVGDPFNGSNFTVNQVGLNCTFSKSPTGLIQVPASGMSGIFTITTQPGCTWHGYTDTPWIEMQNVSGSGSATIPFRVLAQTQRSTRFGALILSYSLGESSGFETTSLNQAARLAATTADFDGDGRTDISIFRPVGGEWWYRSTLNPVTLAMQFGTSGDVPVAADFTGDGKIDIAVFRPSSGQWFILRSNDGLYYALPFGQNGDIPTPADFDGDGKADIAVFRPSEGVWYILRSSDAQTSIFQFGTSGDKPVAADYDGDQKADIAVFRPNGTNGAEWWIQTSSGGLMVFQFGVASDKAVPADYTGDGKTDVAFWRPSNGQWFILKSENFSYLAFPWGTSGDIPAPGDYDGDGTFDTAVFRPSNATWYINGTGYPGRVIATFGAQADQPVSSLYVR